MQSQGMSEKKRIIAGATGLIGTELVNRWTSFGIPVTVITRNKDKAKKKLPEVEDFITWDELSANDLKDAGCVINLAGENIGSKKWTPKRKEAIVDSRVETTRRIAEYLASLGENAPRLLNASGIGIYGAHEGTERNLSKAYDEDTKIDPPEDFLAELGHDWEKAAQPAIDKGVHVVMMRFGVVLSLKGGALPEFSKLAKSYMACPLGKGHQALSWIHITDLLLAIDFLLKDPEIKGPVNLVSPNCIRQRELIAYLAIMKQHPYWETAFLTRLMNRILTFKLGMEMAELLLFTGQHVLPKRLLTKKFDYTYPTIKDALKQLYK